MHIVLHFFYNLIINVISDDILHALTGEGDSTHSNKNNTKATTSSGFKNSNHDRDFKRESVSKRIEKNKTKYVSDR